MSIDHGKVLAEIEHEITAMATKVDVTVRLGRASNIMAKVRALAQPAEAVEGEDGELLNDLEAEALLAWPRGVEQRFVGAREQRIAKLCKRAIAALAHDAAQGAVATFTVTEANEGDQFPDGPLRFTTEGQELRPGTYSFYTHPQAAPAQGCRLTLPDSRLDAALDLLCGLTGEHRQRITDDVRMDHLCDTARQIAALAAPAQGDGVGLIAAERRRQIDTEGWTTEHDDEHAAGELARAAGCYALAYALHQLGESREAVPAPWPWDHEWWKPTWDARQLVKAGALIAAEIDRLQRAAAPSPEPRS